MADPDYSPYVPIFEAAGQQWDVDPTLLHAIARTEKGIDEKGNPQTSRAGALGIMQFMPDTATEYKIDPTDASSSIYGAAHKMSDLLQYYGGDVPSALAAYNGSTWDQGQKYAKSVKGYYTQIQAEQAAAQKALEAQSPGGGLPPESPQEQAFSDQQAAQAQASPIRPKGAVKGPDYLDKSIKPGSQAETPIPPIESPSANIPSITTPPDFGKTLYGTPAQSAAPAGGATDAGRGASFTMNPQQGEQQPTTQSDQTKAPDYGSVLYGQPAPEPGAPTGTMQQGGGADLPSKSPYEPPTYAPTPETWWGRNVAAPWNAIQYPNQLQPKDNNLLGTPGLQWFASGMFGQAPRDMAQTFTQWAEHVDQALPWLRKVDEYFGRDPGTTARHLAAETEAYNKDYGSSWIAGAGRLGGQLAGAEGLGVTGAANLASRVGTAIPVIGRYAAPILAGGVGGGLQNMLTSGGYGQDPLQALEEGTVGGAVLGGALGNAGLFFNRGMTAPRVQIARDLEIPLSRGDIMGPGSFAKGYEDTTAPLPFSGEGQKVAAQQQAITRRLATEMGEPPQDILLPPDMDRIRQNIGQRIDQATQNIDVPSSPQFMRDMAVAENAARQSGPDSPQWHNFVAIRDQLLNQMANNGGTLPGPMFQRFIARGGTLDNALNSSNGDVVTAARAVRDAMFDAAGNNAAMPPSALRDLQAARYQWKVEEAVRDSIERAASGSEAMSFPKLAGSLRKANFYPGSPMSNLSQLLYDMPSIASSGTAERSLRQRLIGLLPGEAGGFGIASLLNSPTTFEHVLTNIAAPIAGNIVGGRASRFGAGLGLSPVEAARLGWNPLMPRVFGGPTGNYLMNPQPQPAQ